MLTIADGATALSDLRTLVNAKLHNYAVPATATATGDGVSAIWELPHANIVEDSLDCTVASAAVTPTVDCPVGVATFATAPAEDAEIWVAYQHIRYPEDDVNAAINEALLEVWAEFHQVVIDTDSVTADATTYRYELPDDCAYLFRVEHLADSTSAPKRVRQWDVEEDEFTGTLILYQPEGSGTYRLHYVKQLTELTDDIPVDDTDALTMEEQGIPTQAKWGVVWLACAHLIESQLGQRARSNRFFNVEGSNVPKIYEIQRIAADYRGLAEIALARARKSPRVNRI
jgi:hypothetical protein